MVQDSSVGRAEHQRRYYARKRQSECVSVLFTRIETILSPDRINRLVLVTSAVGRENGTLATDDRDACLQWEIWEIALALILNIGHDRVNTAFHDICGAITIGALVSNYRDFFIYNYGGVMEYTFCYFGQ